MISLCVSVPECEFQNVNLSALPLNSVYENCNRPMILHLFQALGAAHNCYCESVAIFFLFELNELCTWQWMECIDLSDIFFVHFLQDFPLICKKFVSTITPNAVLHIAFTGTIAGA